MNKKTQKTGGCKAAKVKNSRKPEGRTFTDLILNTDQCELLRMIGKKHRLVPGKVAELIIADHLQNHPPIMTIGMECVRRRFNEEWNGWSTELC